MAEPLRIVIVEDEQLIAKFLESWLAAQPDCTVVGCCADAKSGWDLCLAAKPDLALLDIHLPGLDGLELGRRLLDRLPDIRLLALSGHTDPQTVWRACQCGVHGFIEKNLPPNLLITAIRTVASGEPYFSEAFESVKRQWLSQPDAFHKVLSEREQQVLQQVASGRDDARIGAELNISAATVAVHRKHIRQKLALHSDRELIGYARQWGLDKHIGSPGPANPSLEVAPPSL